MIDIPKLFIVRYELSSMILGIDHIGIVTENLQKAIELYSRLGFFVVHEEVLDDRGIKVVFLSGKEGNHTLIELIEPLNHQDLNNPVVKFLKNRGQGLHHIAVRVSDIKKAIDELSRYGLEIIDKEPRKGARGRLVSFVHPKSFLGVLLELVQS